ncbi:MAG: AtpZ/AtpI family protein [Actinobacteria bacterium]|nr:AtpZ/AtpI family protein [Actinomycetota bacterium]
MSDHGAPGDDRRTETARRQVSRAVGHTVETTSFFGSIMAGLLVGWVADRLAGTDPLFIVIGIVAGFGVGFWKMWVDYTKATDDRH